MIQPNELHELRRIADIQITNAQKYSEARKKAGAAKTALDMMLTANLRDIRAEKPNVGIDMAYLMLIEINEAAKSFYQDWVENEAIYKGLERLLDAYSSKLIMEQSLLKHVREGERFGV